MDFFIASVCSQMIVSSEGHGGSCIYCRLLISGYDIGKRVRYHIHESFIKFPQL